MNLNTLNEKNVIGKNVKRRRVTEIKGAIFTHFIRPAGILVLCNISPVLKQFYGTTF